MTNLHDRLPFIYDIYCFSQPIPDYIEQQVLKRLIGQHQVAKVRPKGDMYDDDMAIWAQMAIDSICWDECFD
ncbi:hypothetical protein ACI3PL_08365, partial [Lacticaseibacillus paracasei]